MDDLVLAPDADASRAALISQGSQEGTRAVAACAGEAIPAAPPLGSPTAELDAWARDGRDVALLLGGPDGLDASLKGTADETLRLSELTLPHALARVLLAEALYRAWTLTVHHPYHRE